MKIKEAFPLQDKGNHAYKMDQPYFKPTSYACESFLEYLITFSLVQFII